MTNIKHKDVFKNEYVKKHTEEKTRQAKAIAVMSFKGGTGKTSLTAGLGLTLVRKGYNVLLIDSDAQSNLTQRVGWTNGIFKSEHRITNLLKLGDVVAGDDDGINSVLQIPVLIRYQELFKIKGVESGKGKLGIIGGSTYASIEANGLAEKYKKDQSQFQYQSPFSFFNSAVNVYKQYFDFILFDTAPSMEGNLLNILAVVAADEVVTPIDGFEAACGIAPMIAFVKNHTHAGDLAQKGITKTFPNMTFAMVKYHRDSKKNSLQANVTDDEVTRTFNGNSLNQNEVFLLLKRILGSYVCDKGVQELLKHRQKVSGFTTTDYTKLSLEIIEKIHKNRTNIHDVWNTDKRISLEIGLSKIEQNNLLKNPIFKNPIFK